MALINANNITYEYFRRDEEGNVEEIQTALKNVSISAHEGQFIAILGHNGSGKSTFAKHLNALLFPSEGTVYIDGMDTQDQDKLFEIRKAAGMVFQNPDNQIIASVVEEDVAFGPENMGIPTPEIEKRVEKALKAVGMTKFKDRSPNALSGGQKQRVAIAGVLAMEPKCIVLDEPTAMLDPLGRQEVLTAVKKLNREKGMTVILITHYMEEVIDADRIFVMSGGEVVLAGTPQEIFSDVSRLKELRLDVPQITLLADELKKAGLPIPSGILSRAELLMEIKRIKGVM